jgi:hypothetical protein
LECLGFGLVKTIVLTKKDYNAQRGVSTANLTGDEHECFWFQGFVLTRRCRDKQK